MSNPHGPPGGDPRWSTPSPPPWPEQQTTPRPAQRTGSASQQAFPQVPGRDGQQAGQPAGQPQWGGQVSAWPAAHGNVQAPPPWTEGDGGPSGGYTQPTPQYQGGPVGQAPQFGYGPQQPGGFGDPAVEAERSKRRWPWVLGGFGVLAVAVVLVLGFVVPGFFHRTVFDAAAVQKGVERTLVDSYRIDGVGSVWCPSDQPVVRGTTFTCEVTVDGRNTSVRITVRNAEGSYAVSRPR